MLMQERASMLAVEKHVFYLEVEVELCLLSAIAGEEGSDQVALRQGCGTTLHCVELGEC